jgi:lipid-binding SYLF domain-containing protein
MQRLVLLALVITPLLAAESPAAMRLDQAATVFQEIMTTPDKGIPEDLLEKAHCIVIVPGLTKGAFIFSGKYGKGYLSCRNKENARWSAPGTVRIEGGGFGLQIGASKTDVILLVMNERGVNRLLASKFTLGGEGQVAAGPVGRTATAQTDALMRAEILSWSRARGAFAGISLEGATLRQDLDDNAALYGVKMGNRQIIEHQVAAPQAAARLLSLLDQHSAPSASAIAKAQPKPGTKGDK